MRMRVFMKKLRVVIENETRVFMKKLRVVIENETRVYLESLDFEIKMRVSQKSAS